MTYAEIEVPASLILFDKLTSYNKTTTADGVQRFLLGQYQDNQFGTVRAEIYTQISPPVTSRVIGASAVMDSLVMQLSTDFYQYGASGVSNQTFQVFELADTIKQTPYFNISKVAYKPKLLAEKTISIDPIEFDQNVVNNGDGVTTNDVTKLYRTKMDVDFGRDIFETIKNDTATANHYASFTGKHKGLAILPTTSDKIFGINPSLSSTSTDLTNDTKLILYYTEDAVQYYVEFTMYPFNASPILGFTSITSNKSGTALQPLTQTNTDFQPADGKLYIESGIGIITKLDFTKYFEYMDTVDTPILNSAELVIENETGDFPPPASFQFRALNKDNTYKSALIDTVINEAAAQYFDPEITSAYSRSVLFDPDNGSMDLKSDVGGNAPLYVSAGTTNSMSAFLTEFFQSQYVQRDNKKRIEYCAFQPNTSTFRKTVNRIVLKNNIKLKIYYTTPSSPIVK